jgi:myo-inositol-1(or 4)-monophosphatase
MNNFTIVAKNAAYTAGKLLKENINGIRTITMKGEIDLVTEMDMRSEQVIVELLRASFSDHGFLAEEKTTVHSTSGLTWIIDPLDGTTNYAHGYPCFSVSIALEQDNEIVLGVVYDPMRDELFLAERGRGASLNGTPIRVSNVDRLIKSLLSTGFPYDRRESEKNNLNYFQNMLMASQEVRRDGSAALDLCSVACGRFDGFWELKLKPWDVAAGILILHEAGGEVSDLSGGRFGIRDGDILASNGKIHGQMIEILRGV